MVGTDAEHFTQQPLHFVYAVQTAVIAAIAAGFGKAFRIAGDGGEQTFHRGDLFGARLPAGHIQLQPERPVVFISFFELLV